MFKRLLLVAVLCTAFDASDAALKETASLQFVLSEALDNTLVFLDIDDTLIRYPYHLGSTPWFDEAYAAADGDLARFHALAGLLARSFSVVPCEANTATIVRQLQQSGAHVMGITGRSTEHPGVDRWPERTIEQLASVGIDLRSSSPVKGRVERNGYLVLDGVAICGQQPKERVVNHLLESLPTAYSAIILVDDRHREVIAFQSALSDVEAVGIWYRRMELEHLRYDADIAAEQLDHLLKTGVVLSDKDAVAQLERGKHASDQGQLSGLPGDSAE